MLLPVDKTVYGCCTCSGLRQERKNAIGDEPEIEGDGNWRCGLLSLSPPVLFLKTPTPTSTRDSSVWAVEAHILGVCFLGERDGKRILIWPVDLLRCPKMEEILC